MCYANQTDIKISIKIMQAKPRKLKFDSILIFPAKVIKQTLEMKKNKTKTAFTAPQYDFFFRN